MDALASLFPDFISVEEIYMFLSIGFAAVVFFYFIYLLRKEEAQEHADKNVAAPELRGNMQRQH